MGLRKGILVLLQLLFVLTACNRRETSPLLFPETDYLSVSEVKPIEDMPMRYPFRVRLNDSYLYVMDLHGDEYYCHQFAYPSMKHCRSVAKRGRGPGEFLDAENIRLNRQGELWILDANQAKIQGFRAEDDSVFNKISLDKRLIRSLDFAFYNDSLWIVPDYTGVFRFSILHPDGSILESRGQIPVQKKDKAIPDLAYAQAWRSFLDYNPENGLLAIVTQLGEVVEIYSLPGDSLVKVLYGKEREPRFRYRAGYAIPDGIMGYSDVFVGKEHIYTLFWGHSFQDIRRNASIEGGNCLRVFDLAGNPVRQYVLDRYITGFCVDEDKGEIIGLDVNSDWPVVGWKLRVKN